MPRQTHFGAAVAVALLVVAIPGCKPETLSPEGSSTRVIPTEPFEADLARLRGERLIPGLSVAVVRSQEVVLARGFGYADMDASIDADENTPYRIASVTKPIAGTLAMKLAELGMLDLDQPMAETPGFTEFCERFGDTDSLFADEYSCNTTLRQHLNHTVNGNPGERLRYNPIAFSYASRSIAHQAELDFSSLVARHIFEPVGMPNSARLHRDLPLPEALASRLAPHYMIEFGMAVPGPGLEPQGDGAAGGIVSTVVDLARFDIALDRGEILSAEARNAMFTPAASPKGGSLPYGVGWYLQDYEGQRLIWHSGLWDNAFSALYLKVPADDATLILLANSDGIWWGNPLDEARVQDSDFARAFLDWLQTE